MKKGTGMFKANISPLVAEQYKCTKLFVVTTESGERVIVDPSLTVLRVYMASFLSYANGTNLYQYLPLRSTSISSLTLELWLVR
jgi:dipeptide/tripeptide permease